MDRNPSFNHDGAAIMDKSAAIPGRSNVGPASDLCDMCGATTEERGHFRDEAGRLFCVNRMLEIAAAWCEREEAKRDRTKISDVRAKEAAAKAFGRPIDHFYHWSPERWANVKHLYQRRFVKENANGI